LALYQQARSGLEQTSAPRAAHAWLAAFCADAHAEAGDRREALAELHRAESRVGGELRWPWVVGYEEGVAHYEACTLAKLDDLTGARSSFAAAAPGLAPKPLAMAQAHHAGVLARTGHLDEARALAMEAFSTARQYGSDRIVQKVRSLPVSFNDADVT
jgi:hypothetical protein